MDLITISENPHRSVSIETEGTPSHRSTMDHSQKGGNDDLMASSGIYLSLTTIKKLDDVVNRTALIKGGFSKNKNNSDTNSSNILSSKFIESFSDGRYTTSDGNSSSIKKSPYVYSNQSNLYSSEKTTPRGRTPYLSDSNASVTNNNGEFMSIYDSSNSMKSDGKNTLSEMFTING